MTETPQQPPEAAKKQIKRPTPVPAACRRDLVVAQWKCIRCGYEWTGKSQKPPVACAKCRTRLWATPYKLKTTKVRKGRKPRKPRKRKKERPF